MLLRDAFVVLFFFSLTPAPRLFLGLTLHLICPCVPLITAWHTANVNVQVELRDWAWGLVCRDMYFELVGTGSFYF